MTLKATNYRQLMVAGLCLLAVGCSSDDDDDDAAPQVVLSGDAAFSMQLLHAADMDGASGALANVDQFSALVDQFRSEFQDSTLLLSSGDNYIPGPRFFAASADEMAATLGVPGNGRADIAFLNAMGFAASAIGNHELDQGTGAFAELIAAETDGESGATYAGASFPYLSSNLDISTDESLAALAAAGGQAADTIGGQVAPSTTVTVNGEQIGIVGATTPTLASITSAGTITINPADANDTAALAASIQTAVDALTDSGINKIILLSHMQQIAIEQALAPLLSGVDVIVAGGSNTLLADSNDTLRAGDTAAGTYPLQFNSASGEPVLLVNTDGDYKYLGRLMLDFDADGRVLNGNLDDTVNGAWAATDAQVTALGATPNAEVQAISSAIASVLLERDGNIVGKTAVYLDGRRNQVRTQETNMGNLTADANLWVAQQEDATVTVSLKNGGGIRSDIGLVVQPPGTTDPSLVEFLPPQANAAANKEEGDISQFDLETVLRFNNGLTLLTVTAEELKDIMEHAVAATEAGATPGQFPQVSGLNFTYDSSLAAREGTDTNGDVTTAGERIRSMTIVDDTGAVTDTLVTDGALVGDATRTIRLVILDFIAKCVGDEAESCGDDYPLKGLTAANRVDVSTDPGMSAFADAGSEQDALAEYLLANFATEGFAEAETPASEDTRFRDLAQ
jgi:2',3'-cyclic-nucleotide 2'-phosphodiesterase (5'-nucleotidase family)